MACCIFQSPPRAHEDCCFRSDDFRSDQTVRINLPPVSYLTNPEYARYGRVGATTMGGWAQIVGTTIPTTFIYPTSDRGDGQQVGVNPQNSSGVPGAAESILAGSTAVQIPLAAGNITQAAFATAVATQLSLLGIYASVTAGPTYVDVTGAINAAACSTGGTFAARGGGNTFDDVPLGGQLAGMQSEGVTGSAAITTARGCQLNPAQLPATPYRICGIRVKYGTTHTAQGSFAVYQGGVAGNFNGATYRGTVVLGTGSVVNGYDQHPSLASTNIIIDPALGIPWIMVSGSAGLTIGVTSVGTAAGTSSNFVATGGQGIWLFSSGLSGSNPVWPATAPTTGASFTTFLEFALMIEVAPFVGDMSWKGRIGTRQAATSLTSTTPMNGVIVSNSYTTPNVQNMTWEWLACSYGAAGASNRFRLEAWQGGAAANDIQGALQLIGTGGQSATSNANAWNYVLATVGVAVAASTRTWMTVKSESPNATTTLRFGATGTGQYSADTNPAAYFNGETTEWELVVPNNTIDGFLLFSNVTQSFSPVAYIGVVLHNNNSVGIKGQVQVDGCSLQVIP